MLFGIAQVRKARTTLRTELPPIIETGQKCVFFGRFASSSQRMVSKVLMSVLRSAGL